MSLKKSNELYAHCILLNDNLKNRIGGNPPKLIENQIPKDYRFYATLAHPHKEGMMLSVLIHNDFGTLIKNNIYPNIEVKVIEHKYSEMGSDSKYQNKNIKQPYSITNYHGDDDCKGSNTLRPAIIKISEQPDLIQFADYYFKAVIDEGYQFLLQIDEEGYDFDMNYVFAYGSLYLYYHPIRDKVIAGYWQYS